MHTPHPRNWARTTVLLGAVAAFAVPALSADALTPIPGRLFPDDVRCLGTGTTDTDAAIIVNVTPILADAPGHGVIAPFATPPTRTVATANYAPGTVDPNLAIVPNLSPAEGVCFKNANLASVDVVVDRAGAINGGAFIGATDEGEPVRIHDTRVDKSAVGPDGRSCFTETPNATLVMNVTPVNATAPGHGVIVSGSTDTLPNTANVNFGPGTVDPNLAIATADANGELCFANSSAGTVDVVVDLLGHIVSDFSPASQTGPNRVLDTRTDARGAVQPGERRCFAVTGGPGSGAVVNLTPVLATAAGDGVLVSSDITARPTAASVNFGPGTVDPNVAIAEVGADNSLCFFNSQHATVHVVADQLGSFAPSVFEPAPLDGSEQTRLDTRLNNPS